MTDIPINPVTRRVQFTGNTGTGPFAFTFNIFVSSDIAVYKNSTLLTLTTDYTVTIAGDGTGSVTLTGSGSGTPVILADVLTIVGARDLSRTTDFVTAGDLRAVTLNEQLDSTVIMAQQLDEKSDRALKFDQFDVYGDATLPVKASRLGAVLAFNATTGNPEAGPTIADVSTLAAITADIATLADIQDGTVATDAITNVNTIRTDVTTVAGVAANVTTVAGIAANVTTVVGMSADVTSVAENETEIAALGAVSSQIALLGTADAIADMNVLGTADVVNDMNVLGSAATVTAMNLLGTAGVVEDMSILATADVVADMNTLATADVVNDMNVLGTADVVSDMNTLGTAQNVTDMNTLAGISGDITNVSGISANVTSVAGVSANVTTVAGIDTEVTTLAGLDTEILALYADLANINTKVGKTADTGSAILPAGTTGQRDVTPTAGYIRYNTTTNSFEGYGASWMQVGPDLFAESYDGTSTLPSATGTNSVAVGLSAISAGVRSCSVGGYAGGTDSFSAGIGSTSSTLGATGTSSVAIGKNALASANQSSSFGDRATVGSSGAGAVAIGRAYASGTDSFATTIGDNTATYGATGANSIAIGQLSKATAANSIAIGDTAISTTANQIALGGTTDTVKISGTYTLPTADGTNGQILVTNGSGALSFATNTGSYSDADVDTHLNTSTATTGEVLSWTGTDYDWVAAGSGSGDLLAANNLSDLANAATARTNLGLGTAAITASTAYATAAQGTTADAALPKAGGTMTGDITMPALGTVDGRDLSVDGAKLDLIAASANNYVHPDHTGEVTSTGDGATVITDNVVDEANLKVSNAPTDGYVLSAQSANTGGLTWVASGGGSSYTDADVDTHLNTGTATTGEVLSWSGTDYDWIAAGGTAYTDADVDTHLNTGTATTGEVLSWTGTDYDWIAAGGGGGASEYTIDNKTLAYTVVSGDLGKILNYTSGTVDVTLTALSSLNTGFHVSIWNSGTGVISIKPNSVDGIGVSAGNAYDSSDPLKLERGTGVTLVNSGTYWQIYSEKAYDYYHYSVTLGANAKALNNYAMALGNGSSASGVGAIAIGTGQGHATTAYSSHAVAIGLSTASGANSTALGTSYASGSHSFAAAITNNTSGYGATGANSIAIGKQAKATGAYGTAIGDATQATASNSVCLGYYSQATGQGSLAFGYDTQATGLQSTAIGLAARNPINGSFKFAGGKHQTSGDSQTGIFPLLAETTDATATAMVTYHNNSATASTDNQVILPNNSAYFFSGTIIAREQASAGTDVGAWEIKGAIRREANAASTVLVKSTIDDFNVPTGWAVALTADTTNGGLAITVTGAAATNIRWVATVNTSEVTY
jgi:trimeric autotransporter adhesin